MRAGARRCLIQIEKVTKSKSATGAAVLTWAAFGSKVWASIKTLKGYEKVSAEASWPGADCTITIKYVSGLLPTMRILYNDKIYSILGINDLDERHRDCELVCRQGITAQ